MSKIEFVVHAHYAIAIDAESAARGIREDIPGWQPMIEPGFQGRMVIVIEEYSDVQDGYALERKLRIFAMGTDGEVRRHYGLVRATLVEHQRVAMPDFIPGCTAVASGRLWAELQERTLARAMPIGWLGGLELALRFHLSHPTTMAAEKAERLEAYRAVSIAPSASRGGTDAPAEVWKVNFGLMPRERLYAMAEVFAGERVLAVEPGELGWPGLNVLRDACASWARGGVLHLAA